MSDAPMYLTQDQFEAFQEVQEQWITSSQPQPQPIAQPAARPGFMPSIIKR